MSDFTKIGDSLTIKPDMALVRLQHDLIGQILSRENREFTEFHRINLLIEALNMVQLVKDGSLASGAEVESLIEEMGRVIDRGKAKLDKVPS